MCKFRECQWGDDGEHALRKRNNGKTKEQNVIKIPKFG